MKLTLLEIVQDILNSMDGDEVNSISDTIEASQVAQIVKSAYIDLVDRLDGPEHYSLFELEATSSSTPTLMTLPSDVDTLLWIKYDNRESGGEADFQNVYPMDLPDFIEMMHGLDNEASEHFTYNYTMNGDTIEIFGYNDIHPTKYTQLEDDTILFDSFDNTVDANLQKSKTLAYGKIIPGFTMSDAFVPSLDSNQFTLLLNEAKRQCFIELKNTQNPISEQRARRAWIRSQYNKQNIPTSKQYKSYPNYGRK